ncbi:MAG: hypothetical protein EBR40_01090 [Proteobacteria bacterium]|jgi:hypothetical protein|nr:hypothetical protein [Pseudomonadota bacterium]
MKALHRFFSLYLRSWWLAPVIPLVAMGIGGVCVCFAPRRLSFFINAFSIIFLLGLLGLLVTTVWRLFKKRWLPALFHFLMIPACLLLMIAGSFILMFADKDDFADNLTIPTDIEVATPLSERPHEPGIAIDLFQKILLDSLSRQAGEDPTITARLPSLVDLATNHPDVLNRYLTSSPCWRVFEEHGKRFATRRWAIGPDWGWDLHGYYSQHDIDRFGQSGIPSFQTRLTLGLDKQPWWRGDKNTTRLREGESAPAILSTGNGIDNSHSVISTAPLAIEVFEESTGRERRLTKASLAFIEKELAALAADPTESIMRSILPPGAISRGSPSLDLLNGMQPGIYESRIRVNPGEPGKIYLKAFEVTKGTPLSETSLKERSNEWVGWSADPGELFLSNTDFTIYEGDWGKPYAARFEVWFQPDSGAPERKLLEKVYKIEGWQR